MRLIVVGGGTAGIPAALRGLDLGADVVLLEKTDRLAGALRWSGAITSGAGSSLQRAKGISDSPQAHADEVRKLGRGRADPALLDLATRQAGATIDWLVSIGVDFTAESPVAVGLGDDHETYRTPRSYILQAPEELGVYRGPVLAARLTEALERAACDRLTVRLDTPVTQVMAVNGVVSGVRSGEEEILADAVILTTGGYGASQRLLHRFHPQFSRLITQGPPHATGDGIDLVENLRGAVVNEDVVLPTMGAIEDPDHPGFRAPEGLLGFGRPPGEAGDIWINLAGRRFVAEDNPSPDARERAILNQPGGVMFGVFDEPMRRGLTPGVAAWTRRCLADSRLVRSATTLAELAVALGVSANALEQTVRQYNEAVTAGRDRLGREALPKRIDVPPFHGVPTASSVIVTFAGVRVSPRLQVLDAEGGPILGLFAAGEVIGGAQVQGDGFSSGMSVTPAIAFGRLAAGYALESIHSQEEHHVA